MIGGFIRGARLLPGVASRRSWEFRWFGFGGAECEQIIPWRVLKLGTNLQPPGVIRREE